MPDPRYELTFTGTADIVPGPARRAAMLAVQADTAEVLRWVAGDPDRAFAAAAAERDRPDPRTDLLLDLQALHDGGGR